MMQKQYETFSTCLDRIIRHRELNAAQLSRILGHKSKTTLSRIFNGTAGPDSIRKIYAELCANRELDLTNEERQALALSVQVDQVGIPVLQARDEISSLLRPSEKQDPPIRIRSGEEERMLSEICMEIEKADFSEILILNCSWKALVSEIFTLLSAIPPERLSIRHYMAINNDPARTAAMIGTLRDLFGFLHYSCFSISDRSNPTGPLAFMGMNGAALRIRSGEKTKEYQIIFTDEHCGVMLETSGAYTYWDSYLNALNWSARPIKTTYPRVTSADDYVTFTEIYRKIEENRNIYIYKPDLCFPLIATHIVKKACLDNVGQDCTEIPGFMDMLEKLAEIQEARYRNIFNQKKAVHIVFFPSALRRFAQTGSQTDHFYLLRPYTVSERIEILSHLVHQIRTNPYFNIYLLRDEQNFIEIEATCYEGQGVQFIPAHTDYNLGSGHTEAIITNEEFCALFLDFFRDDLLVNHVYSPSATVFLLESLISELKAEEAK